MRLASRLAHPLLAAAVAFLLGALLVTGALAIRDQRAGERFDLLRWELDTLPNRWVGALGGPFRDTPPADEVLRAYFGAPAGDAARDEHENAAERIIEARIERVLRDLGLSARVALPGVLLPPVDVELARSPQVLVTSPREVIERRRTDLLRPDIPPGRVEAIETEVADAETSVLVVPSGGVATYPAVVSDRGTYRSVVGTAAHEWVHHYLAFYPLGFNYFASGDLRTINETVADIVGDEVAAAVIERWGDPTRSAETPAEGEPLAEPRTGPSSVDRNAVLRDLRREVDALLADGRIEEAEQRMEEVRQQLEEAGHYIRKINQAYFAWYGTYAARPDAVDPIGGYLREIRERSGSLPAFIALVRDWTSRAEVEAGLVALGGALVDPSNTSP